MAEDKAPEESETNAESAEADEKILKDGESEGDVDGDADKQQGPVLNVPIVIVVIGVVVALGGAFEHAYEPPGIFPWHPHCDLIELSWLAFALIIALINYSEKFGVLGGASVTLRRGERAQRVAVEAIGAGEDLARARDELAALLQSWTGAAALLSGTLERYGSDPVAIAEIINRFALERMEEAQKFLVPEGERVRLSLWWYFESLGGLVFVYGTDPVDDITKNAVFRPRQGLMGQVYIEGRLYNIPDAPKSLYYQKHRPDPGYHGLLLVPVRDGIKGVMGVLSIDRAAIGEFTPRAENIGWALADLIALAYTTPTATERLPEFRYGR